MARPLTDRQQLMVDTLATADQLLSTEAVAQRMNRRRDDGPPLSHEQVVRVGKQLLARDLVEMHGVRFGPKKWQLTDEGREEATPSPADFEGGEEAIAYAILGIERYGRGTWQEIESGVGRQAMVDKARGLLDSGLLTAASVQGRGTPGHPTPPGEAQVYRGVAPHCSPMAYWPDDKDVERR